MSSHFSINLKQKIMRKIFSMLALVFSVAVAAVSCKKDENPQPKPPMPDIPSVSISDVKATFESVSFKINLEKAVSYSYSVAPKNETPEMTVVESGESAVVEVDGLLPETYYEIRVKAVSKDDIESDIVVQEFLTNSKATVKIAKIECTHNTASVTFESVNSDGIKYIFYKKDERPSSPEWIEVENMDAPAAELADLAPETTYAVEAVSYNEESESDPDIKEFTTLEEPDPLEVEMYATASCVYVDFKLNKNRAASYIYTVPNVAEYMGFSTVEDFLADVDANSWKYEPQTESSVQVFTGMDSGSEILLFVLARDAEGKTIESTVQKFTVNTKEFNIIGESAVGAPVLNNGKAGDRYFNIDITLSSEQIMYGAKAVLKSLIGESLDEYISQNLSSIDLYPAPESGSVTAEMNNLLPDTSYVFISFGVDKEGLFSDKVTSEFKTSPMEYDKDVTVSLEVVKRTFDSVTFDVVTAGDVKEIVYFNIDKNMMFGSDEEYFMMLLDPFAQKVVYDENGQFNVPWLMYGTKYVIYLMPVTSDGKYGTPLKYEYSTAEYSDMKGGAATLEIKDVNITGESSGVFTVVPGSECVSMIYSVMDVETYDMNKYALGNYVCMNAGGNVIPVSGEMQMDVYLWADFYIVAIAMDKDGKCSEPIVSGPHAFN